jgi:hypothetical protein
MSRLLLSALLLTSCAAEVAPRADAGDPRVMPVGAVAALDGSFSEGDGLSYAWSVEPEGATLLDAESPFATLIAEAPGFYTLTLEVCDESGRCDVAETWARVDAPGSANKVSDWGLGEFASAESGAGAPRSGLTSQSRKSAPTARRLPRAMRMIGHAFCSKVAPGGTSDDIKERAQCRANNGQSATHKRNWCLGKYCQ